MQFDKGAKRMIVTFTIDADCRVVDADKEPDVDELERAIETVLMDEFGIDATVSIDDYQNLSEQE